MRRWIPRLARMVRVAAVAPGMALAVWLAVAPAAAQPVGGDCTRPGDPLTRMICGSDELKAVSVASARVFSALRQQEGRAAERGLILAASQAQADLLRACGVDVYAPSKVVDQRADSTRQACIQAGFWAQHSAWLARLTGAAREEATRPGPELEQGQMDLRQLGLLEDRVPADGVYRTSTRQAILRWQRQSGRAETGLLGNADAAALRVEAATPAPPVPPPLVVTRPAEGTLVLVPQVDLATGPGMRFTPDVAEIAALGAGARRVIYADGAIQAETPDSLERLLAAGWPEGSVILLASDGGNAVAGLKLGRMIRRAGLVTMIGRRGAGGPEFSGVRCFSACADMFLGGVQRYHANGALYGVHRFRLADGVQLPPERVTAAAQVMSAMHLAYVREMGVDPDLLAEAARADARQINVLSPGRMAELNVITSGGGHAWGVLTVSGQRFLRTHIGDGNNLHTVAFACGPRSARAPLLYVNLRASELAMLRLAVGWPVRVLVDGAAVEITGAEVAGPPRLVDETLAFVLRMTPRLSAALGRGGHVHIAREAPDGVARVGLDLDMSTGWRPVSDFLSACR